MPQPASIADRLHSALTAWRLPDLPVELEASQPQPDIESIRSVLHRRLSARVKNRTSLQAAALDWLYHLVRGNIKRGRAFDLNEVLVTRRADCLGYSQLFCALGVVFGLELGIVEVLVDAAGRYVPHHVNLFTLADGTRRFVDAWYGATDIRHRRIGALVNGAARDIDLDELGDRDNLGGLPDRCVRAIILYIKGNRCLEREVPEEAIRYYSRAVKLYPNNSRAFYNRALAYEMMGEMPKAELDYAQALQDEAGLVRVLATISGLEYLIKLDEKGVSEEAQAIYLWHEGLRTGIKTGFQEIGERFGLAPSEVEKIVIKVARLCAD